jgi:hypothetical protein
MSHVYTDGVPVTTVITPTSVAGTPAAISTRIWTFQDVRDYLLDFIGGSSDGRNIRLANRAILSAYRVYPTQRSWNYYRKRGQLVTDAAYSTGTLDYDHTGGTRERLVTLASGTWPTWAARGSIRFNNKTYRVRSRESATVITLSEDSNPGADVAAGTTYEIYRDTYTLPVDFRSAGQFRDADETWLKASHVTLNEIIEAHRTQEGSGDPRMYAFASDPDYYGSMAVIFYPPPTDSHTWYYYYQRIPRQLRDFSYSTGTITASSSTTSVAGNSTSWTTKFKGSVIRFGDTTNVPTGAEGDYPFIEERVVVDLSGQVITLDEPLENSYTKTKYSLSDPIDMEEGAMYDAFLAHCELRLMELTRNTEALSQARARSLNALRRAQKADNRNSDYSYGSPGSYRLLRDVGTVTLP